MKHHLVQNGEHQQTLALYSNFFIPVSKEDIKAKIKGMENYEFEKREYPHPRSPEALTIQAQRWGIVVGTEFAEAFHIVRLIG